MHQAVVRKERRRSGVADVAKHEGFDFDNNDNKRDTL